MNSISYLLRFLLVWVRYSPLLKLRSSYCVALLNRKITPQNSSRVQRARIGVHNNRISPSKEDYSNFVLYQASQKAYEATFLNNFVAHALHSDQIAQCSEEETDARPSVQEYLRTVSRDINHITNKIIWNAHCRTVHLLANDGKHGAPFLDVYTISPEPFSNYGPDNLFSVAEEMSSSWHRVSPNPCMVQYSMDDYKLAHNVDFLEELDEATSTLLRRENFGSILSRGRAARLSTSRKRRGEHLCGAAMREERVDAPRANWLASPQYNSVSAMKSPPNDKVHESNIQESVQEVPTSSASHHVRHDEPSTGSFAEPAECHPSTAQPPLSNLEELSGNYGNNILDSDFAISSVPSECIARVERAYAFRMKLIKDHKQRLIQKWGNPSQSINIAFNGNRQAVAAAITRGFRPTDTDSGVAKTIFSMTHTAITRSTKDITNLGDGKGRGKASKRDIGMVPEVARQRTTKKRRMERVVAVTQSATAASIKQQTKTAKSTHISARNSRPERSQPGSPFTLEQHQRIPSNAYFEPASVDEKLAWRCGSKHALGHYYNAGDRKTCKGCNTHVMDSPKKDMNFYMPSRTFCHQPVPDNLWKPSKPSKKPRKHPISCHNSIANDAFWEAINAGVTEDEARQTAVDAVFEWLKPKTQPKAPTPEPEPEPEPDLGPHISGSETMEHGQEIPDGYYWHKQEENEEYAWRCDLNHAFGRYYLAGDKKTCPGCGSSRRGGGRREVMDFYLPPGVIVRQEAPGLSKWSPRKPYRLKKVSKTRKGNFTHNQMCSKAYHDLLADGHGAEEALKLAVEKVDHELDRRQEENEKRQYEQEDEISQAVKGRITYTSPVRKDSTNTSQIGSSKPYQHHGNSFGISRMPVASENRNNEDLNDSEIDEAEIEVHQSPGYVSSTQMPGNIDETSSDDEESSSSDSE